MKNYLAASVYASAVRHNIAALRGLVGPKVSLCPVVKDDCYGHGMDVLYPVLSKLTDGFAVASPFEALALRRKGYTGFILCFLSAYFDDLEVQDELVRQQIVQTVMSKAALSSIQSAVQRTGNTARIHLKIDTGMGRLGIPARQAVELINTIYRIPGIELTGIYTHFATAGEADRSAVLQQLESFQSILPGTGRFIRHTANSAAAIDWPESHFDMIRPGIAVYGCRPTNRLSSCITLKPCMSIEAKLLAIKHIPKGSRSGYGLTHEYAKNSRVGVVPIGYGDGYFRSLSNRAVVRIRGMEAPIRGRISMDQMTVDVTDIPAAQIGDEVEVISSNPNAPNCVENLARLANTIPYEITCRLGRCHMQRQLID